MGKYTQHVACPECRKLGKDTKGNNLAIYEDGSAHCFACGYNIGNNIRSNIHPRTSIQNNTSGLFLPKDLLPPPSRAIDWLSKYLLSSEQIEQNNISWSEEEKALVFPIYDENNKLIFFQLRYFNPPVKQPKWRSYGAKPLIYKGSQGPPVLVEDLLSAIRVGEVATGIPLFGSTINNKRLLTIREQHDNITIWLDYDKAQDKKTKEILSSCKAIFKETCQIITEKDPKAYTTQEIKDRINRI